MHLDEMPYAPGGLGLTGHNGAFRNDRLGMLRLLARQTSPVLRLRLPLPGIRGIAAISPDVVQEILVEKARSFAKSDMLRFSLRNLAGEGLFTSNGELWRRQRKLVAPLFTPRALEAYADDMVACTERVAASFGDGQELLLAHATTRLTMGIAGKTLFDADTFDEADELGRALTIALDWTGYIMGRPIAALHVLGRRAAERAAREREGIAKSIAEAIERELRGPLLLVGRRARELGRAIRVLDERVQKMIDARRAGAPRNDVLTRLLEAQDDDGGRMSDRQVRDEVLTLFVAGHETTATGLAWTLHHACRDPELYAALEREVDAVGDSPTGADLPRLELCLRTFKEALRIAPPVYVFGRDSIEPVNIHGYDLIPRTNIMLSPFGLHRSPQLWPEPERFDPSRFTPEREAVRHRYAYLPFGAGPRVCLGNHFAWMEAALALAVLIRRWRFTLLAEDVPEPGATLRPRDGVRVRVHRRRMRAVA